MKFDWTQIPEDILFIIAMKLQSVEDLVVFSAVCSFWRVVYAKVKHVWTPKMPWLMLPQPPRIDVDRQKNRRKPDNHLHLRNVVFDPNVNKIYRLRLPRTFGRRCWGCADGWICSLGICMEFDLINPLTSTHLSLPSGKTLPLAKIGEVTRLLRKKFIKRVNVFTILPNSELVVMVVYTYPSGNQVAFAKPGDSMWKSLERVRVHDVLDIVSFGGQIMLLYEDGTLAGLDMNVFQHPEQKAFKVVEYVPTSKYHFYSPTYLVESLGKLLLIDRMIVSDEDGMNEDYRRRRYKTILITVRMFDFEARDWMEVHDLGDVALFVGSNSSMSLCASKAVNCDRNRVYFTDDKPNSYRDRTLGRDMGIYDLKKRTVKSIYNGEYVTSNLCPPLWYMPKLV